MIRRWEKMNRADFLIRRASEYAQAYRDWEKMGRPKSIIMMEPPQEIICDACNAEVEEQRVDVFMVGGEIRRAHCPKCAQGDW